MNKPYIICHMMTSVDGRIDCNMTAQLRGVEDYNASLAALDAPSRLSGRITGQLELAAGPFKATNAQAIGHEAFQKNREAAGYEIVVDTHGTLRWHDDRNASRPHLLIVSTSAPQEYVDYLDSKHISWIATGDTKIDLKRAMAVVADEFNVRRLAVVGGGHIDGSMLEAGLIDEVSLLIGAGVDGRAGQTAVFDGLTKSDQPISLHLKSVQQFDSDAVWLKYSVD
ncbi:MAG: dihydrofolate reductase family protein [Lactiplantibacillus sp.]|nr:dihydrofolate reductase family protein [Lactiplantibacillus sp.]